MAIFFSLLPPLPTLAAYQAPFGIDRSHFDRLALKSALHN